MKEIISQLVKKAVQDSFSLEIEKVPVSFSEGERGDYATSLPLELAQRLKKSPLEIAERIAEKIKDKRIEKVEAVAPGFVNFFVSAKFLDEQMREVLGKSFGQGDWGRGKTIVIDYSSVNVAKRFGIGHLRSTIIGQAVYNLYQMSGWKCVGVNHLGDWGTQFGKLIWQIKKEGKLPVNLDEMEKMYVDFHQQATLEMEDEAREWFSRLETGDKEARRIWQYCVKASLKEFDETYRLLGIKIDYTIGESFYAPLVKSLDVPTEESQGAKIIPLGDDIPPAMLWKSNGASTYFARDLAAVDYRLKRWKPEIIAYEIGVDQELAMQQLFRVVEKLGWPVRLVHIKHGFMRKKDGKFSTRRGETIHLREVLNKAIEKAEQISDLSAKEVGIGAVIYNDLSQFRERDIIFDWDKVLSLKGNSGPYLQYTLVRCFSLLKQKKVSTKGELGVEEKKVVRLLIRFPEIVKESAQSFAPHILANYLYDLASGFNIFYEKNPIRGNQKRLMITQAVANVLEKGLKTLGVPIAHQM